MGGVEPVWTEHKAKLIAQYLRFFVFITKHGAYIDGFAAPKNPQLPDSWAAELVINSEPKFLKQFYLCDLNSDRVRYLHDLVNRQPSQPKRSFAVFEGDFNDQIAKILASGEIKDKTATFCLLDQYTCECHWETLVKLASHKSQDANKIELFYFLATGWLGRALKGYTKNVEEPEMWWGGSGWKSLLGVQGDKIAIRMAERIRNELGYRFVHAWPIYKKEKGKGRVMFHMIHASDHREAPKLMKRAHKSVLGVPELEEQTEWDF